MPTFGDRVTYVRTNSWDYDALDWVPTRYAAAGAIGSDVNVTNFPASTPVTGSFWQAVQPISGSKTDGDAADGSQIFTLPAQALESNPSYSDGQKASLSLTLGGDLRTSARFQDGGGNGLISDTADPASNARGLIVRAIPSGTATPVSGTFWPVTQPISHANLDAALSTLATSAKQPTLVSGRTPVDGSGVTQPVSGTFWQTTQPVSGTFWQTTQPVSGPVTDAQLRASAVPMSLATLPALVAGNANIGDVDVLTLPVLTDKSVVSANVLGNISLGNSQFKTVVLKTGTLVTTAVTADQVVLTYTVTAGKTFYLCYWNLMVRLTTYAATATNFGAGSLENPSGTKLWTTENAHAGIINDEPIILAEPIPIAAGTVIRLVVTPAAVTSFTWRANFGGYEK